MVHDSLPRDARSRYSSAYALWAMVERCRVPFMATVVGILDLDSWGADTLDAGPPRLAVVVIALRAPVKTVDRLMSPSSHRIAGRRKVGRENGSPLTARALRRSAAPWKRRAG